MMKSQRILRLSLAAASVIVLSACANSGYKQGVAGNVLNYREFSDIMHSQQNTLNSCFNAAGQTSDAQAVAMCAVLAAGTNAQQTLAGRPDPIRVAKSPEEILESVAKAGISGAVKIYGFKQVAQVLGKGFEAGMRDPLVVDPLVVRPEVILVPTP